MKRNEHSVLAVRRHLKLTQVAFARLLGVHSQTVSDWERGKMEPDSWQQSLLALLHLSQPRPNLEERLKDNHSNPVLALAHLLSDHVRPSVQSMQLEQSIGRPPLPGPRGRTPQPLPAPGRTPQLPAPRPTEAPQLPPLPAEVSRFEMLELDDD